MILIKHKQQNWVSIEPIKQSSCLFLIFFLPQVIHDFVDGFLNVINSFAHLIHPADDIAGHFLEPFLHLLEHVLHEGVEFLGGGVFSFLVHLICSKYILQVGKYGTNLYPH